MNNNDVIVKRCNVCPALCCIVAGEIDITIEEAQVLSFISKVPIENIILSVDNGKKYILQKSIGLACIFLNEHGKCSVYDYRPQTCRNYTCKGNPVIYQLWRSHRYVRNNPNNISKI